MEIYKERILKILSKSKNLYSEEYILYAVPLIMSKKHMAYSSMKIDLIVIQSFLNKLIDEDDLIIKSSLTYSIIALYGKFFTDASKSKNPKLETKEVFSKNKNFLELHKHLMSLRHDFIAHRGKHVESIGVSILGIKKSDNDIGKMFYNQINLNNFSKERITSLKGLFNFLETVIDDKIEKSAKKTYKGLMNKYSNEELESYLVNNL